jgi:uroporphyrinogen decarboxylase
MAMTYAQLTVNLLETLFEQEGKPDGVWFYEDMGFKERPFMSPDMYRELIQPAHKLTFDFCHSMGLPVIVHSCGYIDPLIPGMVEAGMDALQVMEVKAGMDSRKVKKEFGDKIALIGGMDVRCLTHNDRDWIDRELDERLPILMENSGYVLHSDHSLPTDVEYETYRYFVDKGLEMGTYK